jgi:hypothetical protein
VSRKDKILKPCIDVCKDVRGRCIACGRSDDDKDAWKDADSREEKLHLLRICMARTEAIGTRAFWEKEYRRKCAKKGVPCALDELIMPPPAVEGVVIP